MSDPAIIQGALVDAKNINVHKSIRLSIDVPAEQGALIVEAFGWPTMAEPVTVAVARLKPEAVQEAAPASPKTKREFKSLPAPQQAGIMANDKRFWSYLREWHQREADSEEQAAGHIRSICGVDSRSEFKTGNPALQRWNMLASGYLAWLEKERIGA